MGPGTRGAREVIRVAWGVHGPVFLTAVRGHDPSRRRSHQYVLAPGCLCGWLVAVGGISAPR